MSEALDDAWEPIVTEEPDDDDAWQVVDTKKFTPSSVNVTIPRFGAQGVFEQEVPENFYEHPDIVQALAGMADPDLNLVISGDPKYALRVSHAIDSKDEATAQQLSEELQLPVSVIRNNVDVYKKMAWYREAESVLEERDANGYYKNPILRQFMANPNNALLAKYKEHAWAELEGAYVATHKGFIYRKAHAGVEGIKGIVRSRLGALRLLNQNPLTLIDQEFDETDYSFWRRTKEILLKRMVEDPALKDVPVPSETYMQQLSDDVMRMVPQVVDQLVIAMAVGPEAALAYMTLEIAGGTFNELTDRGVSPGRAARAAWINGLLQAPLELLPITRLLKKMPGGQSVATYMVKKVLMHAAEEGGTEFVQEFIDIAAEIYGEAEGAGDTVKEQFEYFVNRWAAEKGDFLARAAHSGLVGALTGPVISMPSSYFQFYANKERLQKNVENLRTVSTVVEQLKKEGTPPKAIEKFLEQAAPNSKIFIDPKTLLETFNQEMSPDESIKLQYALEVKEQLDEQVRTNLGADIEISRSKWMTYVPANLITQLEGDVREEINGLSLKEALEREKRLKKRADQLAKMQEEGYEALEKEELPQQIKDIRETLKEKTNWTAQTVDTNMAMFLAMAKRSAEKSGETLEEWATRRNPRVEIHEEFGPVLRYAGLDAEATAAMAAQEGNIYYQEVITPQIALDMYKQQTIPEGWYVHGRYGTQELRTDAVIQVTKNWDVAEQYGGGKGSIWLIKPTEHAKTFDLSDSDTADMDRVVEAALKDATFFRKYLDIHTEGEITNQDIENFIREEFSPDRIVESAEAFDSPELVSWLWETLGVGFVITPDGGVVLDKAQVDSVKVPGITFAQGERRARGQIDLTDPRNVLIKLFGNKNLSTFLHEAFHLFLNDMQMLVESGQADEQTRADYNVLLAAAGGKFDRAGVERLAKMFEAHLMKGKAPSPKLLMVFERIKNWLKRIYGTAVNLGVQVTDELSAVFDRMIASDNDIEAARRLYEIRDIAREQLDASEASWATYQDKRNKARQKAEQEQFKKYWRGYLNAQGGKKGIRAQAEADVDTYPVYRAIANYLELGGLDRVEVERVYGEDAKEIIDDIKYHDKRLIKRGGAVSLSDALLIGGYKTVDEMLNALRDSPRREEAIDNRYKELMAQTEADFRRQLSQGEITEMDDAYHTPEQLDALVAKHNMVAESAGKKGEYKWRTKLLTRKALEKLARDELSNKSGREAIKLSKYLHNELKHAQLAAQAIEDGNLELASAALEKQAISNAFAKEAMRLSRELDKIEKRFSYDKLSKQLKAVEEKYAEAILDLADWYKVNSSTTMKPKESKDPAKIPADRRHLFLDRVPDPTDSIPHWLWEKTRQPGYTSWLDLTVHQIFDLDETIKLLLFKGKGVLSGLKDALKGLEGGDVTTIQEYRDRCVARLQERRPRGAPDADAFFRKFMNGIKGLLYGLVKTEPIADAWDGFSAMRGEGGKEHQAMVTALVEKDAELILRNQQKDARLRKIFERLFIHEAKAIQEAQGGRRLPNLAWLPITDLRRNYRGTQNWNVVKIIMTAIYSGNKHCRQALLAAEGWDDSHINEIFRLFSHEGHLAFQELWDLWGEDFDELDQVHYNQTGKRLEKAEGYPQTVISSDGIETTLEGGYVWKCHDPHLDYKQDQYADKTMQEMVLQNSSHSAFDIGRPKSGMRKARIVDEEGNTLVKKPLYLESASIIQQNIHDQQHAITHTDIVSEIDRITGSEEFKQAAILHGGGRTPYLTFRQIIKQVANPHNAPPGMWDKIGRHLLGLGTISALGLKVRVGLKQRLSHLPALKIMRDMKKGTAVKYMLGAYRQLGLKGAALGLKSSEIVQMILDKSKIILARMQSGGFRDIGDLEKNISSFIRTLRIPGTDIVMNTRDVANASMFFIRWNDFCTVAPVWLAAYNQALGENIGGVRADQSFEERERAAIKHADWLVRTTQPSPFPTDMSRLIGDKRAWVKLISSFMSYQSVVGNLQYKYISAAMSKDLKQEIQGKWQKVSSLFFMNHVMPAWIMLGMGALMAWLIYGDDEEDYPEWSEYAAEPIYSTVQWIPGVRDIPATMKYGPEKALDSIVREGPKRGAYAIQSVKTGNHVMWKMWRAFEFWTGVPVSNMWYDIEKTVKKIED